MPAKPITVQYDEGIDRWMVGDAESREGFGRYDYKQEAVDAAKSLAADDWERRSHTHVIVHRKNGSPQYGWWPFGNRWVRVMPVGDDLKQRYPKQFDEFRRSGHSEPFWKVERKARGIDWSLLDLKPTQDRAIESARNTFEGTWAKRLSIYGADWLKAEEYSHEL